MQKKDLYEILKVSKTATKEEIKKSFRKLAVDLHPDKNNGNKESEEEFKKINEAYNILSDDEKRKQYDQFGIIDGQNNGNASVDLNDILKNMFGGGGININQSFGSHPGGFSFVFEDGGNGIDDIENMFGIPGFPFGGRMKKHEVDVVEIEIDICDIYYGNNKKVDFELLEQCSKCNGSGANDPSNIIKCLTCNGQGNITQQIGPFFMQKSTCPSCIGKGNIIKKPCNTCKGEKTVYSKKQFELKIPKGIPNNHEIKMEKKGSYNKDTKKNKDMIFKFKYKISEPYKLDEHNNVIYTININIEELLGGFYKNIPLYKDHVILFSDRYFNPTNYIVVKEKGLYNIKNNTTSDLLIKVNVEFINSDRLSKYNDVLQKVVKRIPTIPKENTNTVINIQNI